MKSYLLKTRNFPKPTTMSHLAREVFINISRKNARKRHLFSLGDTHSNGKSGVDQSAGAPGRIEE